MYRELIKWWVGWFLISSHTIGFEPTWKGYLWLMAYHWKVLGILRNQIQTAVNLCLISRPLWGILKWYNYCFDTQKSNSPSSI